MRTGLIAMAGVFILTFIVKTIILDAKYKHLNGRVGREIFIRLCVYDCMDKPYGGYVYPDDSGQKATSFQLAG